MTGMVKKFDSDKGFGFIAVEGERDIFVHHTSIQADGYRTLEAGQCVTFDLEAGPSGRPQAGNVVVIENAEDVAAA